MQEHLTVFRTALAPCLAVLAMACSYDWTVGPEESGTSDGGVGADSHVDADSTSEACAELINTLAQERSKLMRCDPQLGYGTCAMPYTDECGCEFGSQDSLAGDAYDSLVKTFHDEMCTTSCSPCLGQGVMWMCEPDGTQGMCAPP